MIIKEFSKELLLKNSKQTEDPIILIQQFFIQEDNQRYKEMKNALQKNVENPYLSKIYLLNERIYSNEELHVSSNKIVQVNLQKRMSFKDVFDFVESENIQGYIVFSNSDIEINTSIYKLNYTNISNEKQLLCLTRYEIYEESLKKFRINTHKGNSQDTWIYHSNFNVKEKNREIFDYFFGVPGCDNKLLYLFKILGYQIINASIKIKTIHHHKSKTREYSFNNRIEKPYCYSIPYSLYDRKLSTSNFNDNNKLYHYIFEKLNKNECFIIPRVGGIENNIVYRYYKLIEEYKNNKNRFENTNLHSYFSDNLLNMFKNNAGIVVKSLEDVRIYSRLYLESFKNSDMYCVWDKNGYVYHKTHEVVLEKFQKDIIWAFTLDIYHYIHLEPWTLSLKGKKILIISSFVETIREKVKIREKIYNIDLFPECEFIFLKPPQTHGNNSSRVFHEELNDFIIEIKKIKNDFDVALVSSGGYGNLICNELFKMNKSSIYIGGVLQMYFGIYGERWLRERSDIMKLYKNEFWSRPKEQEKPKNYKNIEDSCYW